MEEDKQQWMSIAAVVLVIAGLGYFLYRQSRQVQEPTVEVEDIIAEEKAEDLVEQMRIEIPDTAERATLKDVTGGAGSGLATRLDEDGGRMYSVIVGLPEPETNEFYEAYLVGSEEEDEVYMGKLSQQKGGWLLEYSSTTDLGEYSRVKVTKEQVDDKSGEEIVLEGEFR